MDLARRTGALGDATVVAPTAATQDHLELVHAAGYISAVRAARPDSMFGLGTGDNPVFEGMHDASALTAGASVRAAELVWTGAFRRAVSISGGLHHALRSRASGFCIYDDPAMAIAWLLANGAERVAYVDVDVHHGDGVQELFWNDPRVLTVSLHESGATLFPGTGWPDETGGTAAPGSAVNVAFGAGTGPQQWLRTFGAVVPQVLRHFRPQVLVTQHGCDTHHLDPLANLELTIDAQAVAHRWLRSLADELCGGRWVALGGGGYAATEVVPRSWTQLIAAATGTDVAGETPQDWRQVVLDATDGLGAVPTTMLDGGPLPESPWQPGGDPRSPAAQTRAQVWPLLGLSPDLPGELPAA